MHNLKLSKILDILLTAMTLFILFFCWIRFYTKNLILSILIALLTTFLIVFLLFFHKHRKDRKKDITAKQKKLALDCATQFRFSSPQAVQSFFFNILKEKYKVTKKDLGLLIAYEDETLFFMPSFQKDIFTSDDLANIYSCAKKYGATQLSICSTEFNVHSKNLAKAIKTLPIFLLDIYDTYGQIIAPSNRLPEKVVDTQRAKLTFKQVLSFAVSKERTKNYFLLGIVLIFSSFFVLFKVYYLVFGSLLLAMAALTRVLPHKQKAQISSVHL